MHDLCRKEDRQKEWKGRKSFRKLQREPARFYMRKRNSIGSGMPGIRIMADDSLISTQ